MRNGFLAAFAAVLACHGLAFAQEADSLPAESFAEAHGFYASADYLFWWFKNGNVPPLVIAGGNGIPGSPGTQVLLDNLNFANIDHLGGRFSLGYWFENNPCLGIEANYFFLGDRHSSAGFSSNGEPVLGQPYINAVTGLPAATFVGVPGTVTGSINVGAQTSLTGAEANFKGRLFSSDSCHLTALGGFRYLRLADELTNSEHFFVSPTQQNAGGGSTVNLRDDFRTLNNFYGGQVGLEAGIQRGRFTLDLRGKLALGQMQQSADVNGSTDVLNPNGTMTHFTGGLYALRSNIGTYHRDELAFIPEAGLNVGMQVTSNMKVYAGYSFLWVSNVSRAGEQIDPVVNVSQFPILSGNAPLMGPARPAFNFNSNDFWAQGVNIGLELRY